MKINILGIAETRWQGTNSIKHKGKFMIYSGGDKHERGVGIIFDERKVLIVGSLCQTES